MLGLNNDLEPNALLVKRFIEVVMFATEMSHDAISKIFNLTSGHADLDLSVVLNAFNVDFDEGFYTNYLSLGFLLPKLLINSPGTAALNYANYLKGVEYMQTSVIMDNLLRVYARPAWMKDTILELIHLMHGVNGSQTQAIHNLTSLQMADIDLIKFEDLEAVGVALKELTLSKMLMVAVNLGNKTLHYVLYLLSIYSKLSWGICS